MIAYASQTHNRRNLTALRIAGWGLMLSPVHGLRGLDTKGFPRYCLDNGAWSAYIKQQPFNEPLFHQAYELRAAEADFVVLPDIVAGGLPSLEFSLAWQQRLGRPVGLQLLAVQDGMAVTDISPLIGPNLGIFLGGTSQWKERTMKHWGELAHKKKAYFHVGRVNTRRRIMLCAAYGADSFDGSSVSRFATTLPLLENARQQPDLLGKIKQCA